MLDGGDDLLASDGWNDALTISGITANASGANILNWEQVTLSGGATINLLDAALTVGSDPGNGLFIGGSARLSGNGSLTLNGNLENAGTIDVSDGSIGDALSINGDYAGGGNIIIDAALDDGTAGADTLVITGGVSNTTRVAINNVGGLGGETTGNGILLLTTFGDASNFVLAGSTRAGDYRYDLVRLGNNWFLQSAFSPLPKNIPVLGVVGKMLLIFLMPVYLGFQLNGRHAL